MLSPPLLGVLSPLALDFAGLQPFLVLIFLVAEMLLAQLDLFSAGESERC